MNQSGVVKRHFFTLKIDSEALDLKKEKSPKGALFLVWRKVLMVQILVNVVHLWSGEKSSWCKQEHHHDFSPSTKCHIYWSKRPFGANFYLYRSPIGIALPYVFFSFQIFRCGHLQAFLGAFFWSKEQKTLNAHVSKSLLAPKGLFSKTLQIKVCLSADVWTHFLMRIFLSKRNQKNEQLFDKKAPF